MDEFWHVPRTCSEASEKMSAPTWWVCLLLGVNNTGCQCYLCAGQQRKVNCPMESSTEGREAVWRSAGITAISQGCQTQHFPFLVYRCWPCEHYMRHWWGWLSGFWGPQSVLKLCPKWKASHCSWQIPAAIRGLAIAKAMANGIILWKEAVLAST